MDGGKQVSWEAPLYEPPSNLEEDVPDELRNKPFAMMHEIIRQTVKRRSEDTVKTIWVSKRAQKIMLNSPGFNLLRRSLLSSESGLRELRVEVNDLIYHNFSLPKVPNSRKLISSHNLLRISEDCDWYICRDKRTLEELKIDFGEVIVLEHNKVDLRLVRPNPKQKQTAVDWHSLLESHRETPEPLQFIQSVWDENSSNQEHDVPSDLLRHYHSTVQRDKIGLDRRIRQSFEKNPPLDGWPTTKAILIEDKNAGIAYGLAYNPSQNYSWATEGWSISRWKIDDQVWPEEPEIRHIGSVNGVPVSDLGPIYDIMRALRCCCSKVNLEGAIGSNTIGLDLPYSPKSPTAHHSYWLEVARALYACQRIPVEVTVSMTRELLRRTGWEVIN